VMSERSSFEARIQTADNIANSSGTPMPGRLPRKRKKA
jgi:hypothetical protein